MMQATLVTRYAHSAEINVGMVRQVKNFIRFLHQMTLRLIK